MQKPNPIHSAIPISPSWESTIRGSTIPASTDPSLEKLRLTPKAKASSFPLNQLEIIADLQTN